MYSADILQITSLLYDRSGRDVIGGHVREAIMVPLCDCLSRKRKQTALIKKLTFALWFDEFMIHRPAVEKARFLRLLPRNVISSLKDIWSQGRTF